MTTPGTGLLSRMRSVRLRPAAVLGLVAYILAAAILPPGHMAAPLASGSAFHLCPGDARSVLILGALVQADAAHSAAKPPTGHPPHHRHGAAAADATAASSDGASSQGAAAEAAEPRFDSNCASAGPGVAAVAATDHAPAGPGTGALPDALPPVGPPGAARWLRPAPRSPPA